MPKITYQPLDRLDPMFDEAPTRYSPRVMGEADQNNRQRNHRRTTSRAQEVIWPRMKKPSMAPLRAGHRHEEGERTARRQAVSDDVRAGGRNIRGAR
jgi:hypothetical protein